MRLNAAWYTEWYRMEQPAHTTRYREHTLRLRADVRLPGRVELGGESKTRILRGQQETARRNCFSIVDLTLSRSFLKDRLRVTCSVRDLLNQNSTYRSTLTELARTERYTDVLPRHFLLSVQYSLRWEKKKAAERTSQTE